MTAQACEAGSCGGATMVSSGHDNDHKFVLEPQCQVQCQTPICVCIFSTHTQVGEDKSKGRRAKDKTAPVTTVNIMMQILISNKSNTSVLDLVLCIHRYIFNSTLALY